MEKEGEKKYRISSKLTDQELIKLQYLLENKEIEDLEIFKFSLQDYDQETLKKLEAYNHLKGGYFVIQEEESFPFFVKLILGNKLEYLTLDLPLKGCLLIYQALNENKHIENLNIYQNFQEETLESIQNLVNTNTNLKSLNLQNFDYLDEKFLDLGVLINGIQDNSSIQYLSLNPINVKQKEVFKSFNKLKSLKNLLLRFIKNEESETLNNEDEFSENQPLHIENPFNFSMLSIKIFDFYSSRIDNKDMIHLMKSLKEVAFFEELNFSYSKIYQENLNDDFFEWMIDLKEILVNNKNLKKLNISSMELHEKDFEILCEGFEKNESLTSLDIEGNTLGKCSGQIGKIFKSKANLEDFYIGDNNFNFNEFMKEFQFQENLKYFYLSKCNLDKESDELISNFLSNNRNIIRLTLYVNSIESAQNTFKALNSHKKVKELTIDSKSSIPGKYIVELVKNNLKFEYISFSRVDFKDNELKECFDFLSKDSTIKSFKLSSLNPFSSSEFIHITEEYMFYNYSLIDFNLDEYKPKYCQRNKEFITNYYKIKNLKFWDIFYSFI